MFTKKNVLMYVLLSIVTCGIWSIVWLIQLVDDVNMILGKKDGTSGILVFVFSILTCGIYAWYWMYKAGEAVDTWKSSKGLPFDNKGIVYLLLSVFGLMIVAMALLQSDLNEIADANIM